MCQESLLPEIARVLAFRQNSHQVDDGERTLDGLARRRGNVIMGLLATQMPTRAERDPGDLAPAA